MELLDPNLVRAFVTVAETGHVGRAATRLHLTQPSVSKQLQRLQRTLGLQLLDRSAIGMSLTPAGAALLPAAVDLLRAADAVASRARELQPSRRATLVVAFTGQALNEYTPTLTQRFAAAAPDTDLLLRQYSSPAAAQAVRDGSAELAILRMPVSTAGLRTDVLLTEPRAAVLPEHHPLARHPELSLAQLLGESWIVNSTVDGEYQAYTRADAARGDRPISIGATISTIDEYLEAVLAGRGVGLAPLSAARFYARPGIVYRPVPDAEPSQVALARSDRRLPSAGAVVFSRLARQVTAAERRPRSDATSPRL